MKKKKKQTATFWGFDHIHYIYIYEEELDFVPIYS